MWLGELSGSGGELLLKVQAWTAICVHDGRAPRPLYVYAALRDRFRYDDLPA